MAPDELKALVKLNGWDARITRDCPSHGVWRFVVPAGWVGVYNYERQASYDPALWYSREMCPPCREQYEGTQSYPNSPVWWWYEAS